MKMSQKLRRELESILKNLDRGTAFIDRPTTHIAIATKSMATGSTDMYTNKEGAKVLCINKQAGSDLTGVHTAQYKLTNLLKSK